VRRVGARGKGSVLILLERDRKSINTDPVSPGGTRTPDHLIRSHTDGFNISTRTVTCDACRVRKTDVTHCFTKCHSGTNSAHLAID